MAGVGLTGEVGGGSGTGEWRERCGAAVKFHIRPRGLPWRARLWAMGGAAAKSGESSATGRVSGDAGAGAVQGGAGDRKREERGAAGGHGAGTTVMSRSHHWLSASR